MNATSTNPESIRGRLERALSGEPIERPVYAVYDWFVQNRPIDWPRLFAQGLGQLPHAPLVDIVRPHLEIVETTTPTERGIRRDVRWITDRGELHEWYLGDGLGWRQEHFIKSPADYRIAQRAFEDSSFLASDEAYRRCEAQIGDTGLTLGMLWRTPFFHMQVDLAGLERFSLDLADETPELMELLELMSEQVLAQCKEAVKTPAKYVKLWENLSAETVGRRQFCARLVPLYRQILDILHAADKQLLIHADGKLRLVADQIAALGIDGIDSFTPPPEGDMSVAEGRAAWPEAFLWLHPSLGWYLQENSVLAARIEEMARQAGPRRFCLMISENVPPRWEETVPLVLQTLDRLGPVD